MTSVFNCKCTIPEALKLDRDELSIALVCATAEPGAIGKAALRLARHCLPHFAQEEHIVFPLFDLLDELASGDIRPEMADLLPLVYSYRSGHARSEHRSIDAAIDALLYAARAEDCAPMIEFAISLQRHQQVKKAVIYPAVTLIGKYLRRRLGCPSSRRQGMNREPVAAPDPLSGKLPYGRRMRGAVKASSRAAYATCAEPRFSA